MLLRLPRLAEMHRAVRARDADYDGVFWFAVKTTGVYCRPSCRSRPENLGFFASVAEASAAGHRP